MKPQVISLSSIRPHPKNPRKIDPAEFEKLKESIKQDPEILTVNPLVLDSKNNLTILAGQWRYTALIELGYTEIPPSWILYGDKLTDAQKEKFLLLDNHHSGTWDVQKLLAEWDVKQIADWNITIPDLEVKIEMPEILSIQGNPEPIIKAPSATDDNYSVFEVVMLHENKLQLLEVLNKIKTEQTFEKIEESLMHLVHNYQS
jgi:hypothetical protein